MPPITARTAIFAALALVFIWLIAPAHILPLYSDSKIPHMIAQSLGGLEETDAHHSSAPSPSPPSNSTSHVESYFGQVFAPDEPDSYDFPALKKQCDRTTWKNAAGDGPPVYLQCEGIYLGLTSVISQVKSCLKMAIEAGTGVLLPAIPLRDADNLLSYNQGNPAAERAFGDWFDENHLVTVMESACPGLEVIAPKDLEATTGGEENRPKWTIDIHAARFFRDRDGYFWAGKPFGAFFDGEFARQREEHDKEKGESNTDEGADDQPEQGEARRRGDAGDAGDGEGGGGGAGRAVVVVGMRADFELFNVANDPTGHDRHLWDDLGRALRFLHEPRAIVDQLLGQLDGPFFAVHFRGEGDNMWASPEEQIHVDLDALDRAWAALRGSPGLAGLGDAKPPVYLACGDEGSLNAFVEAGRERGWNITSKYALAKAMGTTETMDMIEGLPFDFQAIIDLGLLVRSHFFIGIMGSAFSYTVANVRDPLTRYRGSSFDVSDDGGARTHMFPNADRYGDTTMEKYACCL